MLPNAQPRPRPAIFDKREAARDKVTALRRVHLAVDLRDGHKCRCCGRKDQIHKHHLTFRSKGGGDCTENLVSLCAGCHALIHARQLWILGKNADKRLTFELHERACVDVFGNKPVPRDVRLITSPRDDRAGRE